MPAAEVWCSILQEDISFAAQQDGISQRPFRGCHIEEIHVHMQALQQTVCSLFVPR